MKTNMKQVSSNLNLQIYSNKMNATYENAYINTFK